MNSLYPYKRAYNPGIDSLYTRTKIRDSFGEKEYHCELKINNEMMMYTMFTGSLFLCEVWIDFEINKDINNFIHKIINLIYYYTKESIRQTLHSYPCLLTLMYNERKWFPDISWEAGGIRKQKLFKSEQEFLDHYEATWAYELFGFTERLMSEVQSFHIDFSTLEKKQNIDLSFMPDWMKRAAIIGGVFLLKFTIKSVINSIDIDFDFDSSDNDSGYINVDDGSIVLNNAPDFSNNWNNDAAMLNNSIDNDSVIVLPSDLSSENSYYSSKAEQLDNSPGVLYDPDNGNAFSASIINPNDVSFRAKRFDGFQYQHQKVLVPTMGNGASISLDVYKKIGHNGYWVSTGSCVPVSLVGSSWVSIGGYKFKVDEILKKIK